MRAMLANVLGILGLAAGVFVVLCAMIYWGQAKLIFYPRPNDPLLVLRHQPNRVQIRGPEGALEGWWTDNPKATTDLTVLYFGGNAEDVLYTALTAPLIDARRMLVVNYRGYGRSVGRPSQEALYEDALAIHRHLTTTGGVRPEQLIVMGRSLGSGVAAMLASEANVAGAVLITPYDSLAAVGAYHYPYLPVRFLLRHKFPSAEWARKTSAPALLLAAERDRVVPPVHARSLLEAWAGPKALHTLEDVGHNDVEQHADYYRLINEFLRERARASGA
jgi:pimeloyl-ACP methyl ester carboxylesterase